MDFSKILQAPLNKIFNFKNRLDSKSLKIIFLEHSNPNILPID